MADGGRVYVPALDGVRALAVLAVIGTHIDLPGVPGGYLGVDVFFVLSGFLITRLLVEERARTGSVAWRHFYVRRALRLLPALLTVCAFALAIAYASRGLGPDAYSQISAGSAPSNGLVSNTWAEVRAALLYGANFPHLFGVERDVFLGHTWSLAVEEQFYVVWPLLFGLVVSRLSPRRRTLSVVVAAAGLSALRIADWPDRLAPMLHSRYDLLLLGVAAALALDHSRTVKAVARAWPAALVALAWLVTWGVVTLDSASGRLLFTVAGLSTVSVVVAAWTGTLGRSVTALLTFGPLVFLGRISYGLYLWHLPIVRRVAMADLARPSAVVIAIKLGLVLAAAVASYFLLERPALRLKNRFRTENPPKLETPNAAPAPA